MLIKQKDKRLALNQSLPKSRWRVDVHGVENNTFNFYPSCFFRRVSSIFSGLACLGILIRSISMVA
jgi:hypothetical protein